MAKRKVEDEPAISKREALNFFNVGKVLFQEKWERVYQYKIRHFRTAKGIQLSLIDVINVAFPSASNQTAHMVALQYLVSSRERRAKKALDKCEESLTEDGGAA